ncbi:MAG: tetratricopeptide repeat protein [Bacteroidales bacterium]|nr:tetratricopeptide repeat protein [Bacteroidales bacterium]
MEKFKYRLNMLLSSHYVVILLLMLNSSAADGQSDRQHIREGNRDYRSGKFNESEISYRRATEIPKSSPDAWFNMGNAIYRQNRYDDAASTFEKNAALNEDELKRANSYYNMGNALLSSQKIKESIDAYKKSLRLNPESLETKYNLTYAQDLLKQQEQQEQQEQQNNEQNQNKDQDKNSGDNQEKEKNEDKEQNQDQNQNQNQDSGTNKENQEGQQQISQEDARRLLEALAADEQKIQEKVKKDKAAAGLIRTIKNW